MSKILREGNIFIFQRIMREISEVSLISSPAINYDNAAMNL